MKKLFAFLALALPFACTAPAPQGNVEVGGLSEAKFADSTVNVIAAENLGRHTVLFKGPWNPYILRKTAAFCRENGLTLTMDEVMDRRNVGVKKEYQDSLAQIMDVLREYADVVKGSLMLCEFGGANFSWPASSVANANAVMPPRETYAEADAFVRERIKDQMARAEAIGLPRPYVSIEACYGAAHHLLRSGIDRVDVEMTFTDMTELRFAGAMGASRAFGKKSFGVDNAMLWYGGDRQNDAWFNRFRTSLYHSWLRGANPIYAEHGLMNYRAFGKNHDVNHPLVKRFRSVLGDFAAWAARNPRPEGLPRATVAFFQGRLDGYVGGSQSFIWGQRGNEAFRVDEDASGWTLLHECYRRSNWSDRDKGGDINFSGNPPLGTVNLIPYDTPDEVLSQFKLLIFTGFNSMDDALYQKLIRYVEGGGTVLMAARHLGCADRPGTEFQPYNGGDWSALAGVKVLPGVRQKEYGLKFVTAPSCGWPVHQYGSVCDPIFSNCRFLMPELENAGADTLAVGSKTFLELQFPTHECVLYEHRIGKGSVIFVPSLDPVGSAKVRPFYRYLMLRALEAVDVYPKVECGDVVRWACYDDGTVVLLNTEDHLEQQVIVYTAADRTRTLTLAPGELKMVK